MAERFTVIFDDAAAELLTRLAGRRGSKAEVLRDALGLAKEYQDATLRNARVCVLESDGSMRQLVRV